MKQDKTRHIPAGYSLVAKDERYGFEVYGIESPSVLAICFIGKAFRPSWHYRFQDISRRNIKIEETLRNVIEVKEFKEKQKSQRLAASASHDVKAGDIFKCSWGYDQTNIDYYQVMSVSGQLATICAIAQNSVETAWLQGTCSPIPDRFIGKPRRVKIQRFSMDSEPYFRVNSFSSATRIKPLSIENGKPIYKESHWTAYA